MAQAQAQINIKRLVDNIKKTSIYTPIIEAIVNSLDSISEANPKEGEIVITFYRSKQKALGNINDDENQPFDSVTITDNGIGFNDRNLESFNTIYTEKKIREGGKGFGRLVFLKYFDDVRIESVYKEKGHLYQRKFKFAKDSSIIQNEKTERASDLSINTTVSLSALKIEHINKLEKTIETISRKLLEKLLFYFVVDDYKCPKIIVKEDGKGSGIVLNDFFGEGRDISKVVDDTFELESQDKSVRQLFKAKVFKIFYGESRSSINLVADRRLVTEEAIYNYVPEFKDDFYDVQQKGKKEIKKNYTIKVYVQGKYLDENVSLERDGFEFTSSPTKDLFYPFSKAEIEEGAANITKKVFGSEVRMRQDKKEADIKSYIDEQAPWLKSDLKDLDLSKISFNPSPSEIEISLEKIRFEKEQTTRSKIIKILENQNEDDVAKEANALIQQITDIQKNELAHYVALRRSILDIFKKSLSWDEDKRYEKEKVIHDIIFPTHSDSDSIPYEKHNLWLIDEKLSFTEYVASDKPLNSKDERPDILVFDKKIVVRDGETPSNPIIIFELKKPQRNEYADNENPLKQMAEYVKKIRTGEFKNPVGRNINATADTPAFAFLVCDLTKKIRDFCDEYSLVESPDKHGYFGFHPKFKIYFEVVAFDKLVNDSEMRNRIFFKKLGIH